MAVFNDANLEKAYQNIYGQLQNSGGYTPIAMPEQTLESITDQLSGVLRPQYERAIAQRYGATKEQKRRIDVDAASRGMTPSTWVTDAKNRIMNAEAADIAGMESDYASQLAGDALNQYNNYLGDKLALDQYNQKLAQALGDDAYQRVMNQLSAGLISPVSKGGKGGGNPKNDLPIGTEVPEIGTTTVDPVGGVKDSITNALTGLSIDKLIGAGVASAATGATGASVAKNVANSVANSSNTRNFGAGNKNINITPGDVLLRYSTKYK